MMSGRRVHYAAAPVTLDYSRVYRQPDLLEYEKPRGLWYSVSGDDDWPSWCQAEQYRTGSLASVHAVDLDMHRILVLRNVTDIELFHHNYGIRKADGGIALDWHRVSAEWAGIEIAPYQWALRLETGYSWYYGWDCASGCIWDLSAIQRFELIDEGAA